MAQFEVNGFDKIITQLEKMGKINEIGSKMLEESVDILKEDLIKEALKHKDTGAMADSIQKTGVNFVGGDYYICVRPTGKDKKGVRNMAKLVYLEYGVKGRTAIPIVRAATINATPKVQNKMIEIYKREVNN